MAHYEKSDSVPYGESSVQMVSGIVLDDEDRCAYCGKEFEAEDDGEGGIYVTIPVETEKHGNYCSKAHRAQSMYEAQDAEGKLAMRRLYLGARLIDENHKAVAELENGWDVDADFELIDDIQSALSPDGGIYGKEGVEDYCDAFLLPKAIKQLMWSALYDNKQNAHAEVYSAEHLKEEYVGATWRHQQIERAKSKLAEAKAALAALNALREVL